MRDMQLVRIQRLAQLRLFTGKKRTYGNSQSGAAIQPPPFMQALVGGAYNWTMLKRSQFSLRYLLLETLWVAISLGSFRASAILTDEYGGPYWPLFLVGIVTSGAALGGLFGNMLRGAIWTVLIAFVAALLMPAVMH
jgi:hypothetical protein